MLRGGPKAPKEILLNQALLQLALFVKSQRILYAALVPDPWVQLEPKAGMKQNDDLSFSLHLIEGKPMFPSQGAFKEPMCLTQELGSSLHLRARG